MLTLDRPDSLNAMTVEMGDAVQASVAQLSQLPPSELRALVITGAGRAFSAGGDMAFLHERKQATPTDNAGTMLNFYRKFLSIRSLPVPIICCVNGPAIGAGACFAMAADVRFTHAAAKHLACNPMHPACNPMCPGALHACRRQDRLHLCRSRPPPRDGCDALAACRRGAAGARSLFYQLSVCLSVCLSAATCSKMDSACRCTASWLLCSSCTHGPTPPERLLLPPPLTYSDRSRSRSRCRYGYR